MSQRTQVSRLAVAATAMMVAAAAACTINNYAAAPDSGGSDAAPDQTLLDDATANDVSSIDSGTESGSDVTSLDAGSDGNLQPYRRIFITSIAYPANFGGLTSADGICNLVASTNTLGGTWMAWLSSSTTSAESRLEHASVPYERLDGVVVAADWAELTSGALQHDINVNEHLATVTLNTTTKPYTGIVFTATDATGSAVPTRTCNDWTVDTADAGAYSRIGYDTSTDSTWSAAFDYGCNQMAALYCVEQHP